MVIPVEEVLVILVEEGLVILVEGLVIVEEGVVLVEDVDVEEVVEDEEADKHMFIF
jgi:hypothetical protein